jgi:hypothetical protein
MATKILQLELLESNLLIELEAEETMCLSTLISKLRTEEYLKDGGVYWSQFVS